MVFFHLVVLYLVNSLFRRDWGFRQALMKVWDGKAVAAAAARKAEGQEDGDGLTVPLKCEEESMP